ncbi:MAG: hypothetical protein IJ519_04335 [Clostridia bacterium]|nr:hypothetical protein [Clostridia bacterium]
MKKAPISFIIDDPTPGISVYYTHAGRTTVNDGRPLQQFVPNSLLFDFCDVIEEHGVKGKFSLVPMPGNKGDIVNGIEGVTREDMIEWLDTVKSRVHPRFSIAPEMLTHNNAVDIESGDILDVRENAWSQTQSRETLTPYISKALSILKEAGFDISGVSSPWNFGKDVEDEYAPAISDSVYNVFGKSDCWYVLGGSKHMVSGRPSLAYLGDGRRVVGMSFNVSDHIWQTMESTDQSEEYVNRIADAYITADGKDGDVIRVLESGGYPLMLTHWQSLHSNGLKTGIRVMAEVCRRINEHLSCRVEWMNMDEIFSHTIN